MSAPSKASQEHNFDSVRASIRKILDQPDYDDGSAGPVFVRLAWHGTLPHLYR